MREARTIVRKHVSALLSETRASRVPDDVVGRLLLEGVIELWRGQRSCEDIASELQSTAENLDPDTDHEFMRP